MKVIGIKGNYKNDAKEIPSVYLMADSSLLKDGKPLFLPDFADKFIAHPALAVRINRLGKNIAKRFAPRYYDAVTVGLCIEAHDFSGSATIAYDDSVKNAFDGSAVLGDFIPVENCNLSDNTVLHLEQDGEVISETLLSDMILDIDSLIEELSKYFTFKIGDILFTGYRQDGAFPLTINSTISGKLDSLEVLHFKVK